MCPTTHRPPPDTGHTCRHTSGAHTRISPGPWLQPAKPPATREPPAPRLPAHLLCHMSYTALAEALAVPLA